MTEANKQHRKGGVSKGRVAALAGSLPVLLGVALAMTVVLPAAEAAVPAHLVLAVGVDPWEAGLEAHSTGEFEKAIAYWRQVPSSHPQHARSLRYIGWETYAKELGQPRKALGYVHRCVLVEPFQGNTWQDLGRTYAALFGISK